VIALIQRVSEARVEIDGTVVGEIGRGILALVGVERGDAEAQAERLVEKVLGYRIFPDATGKMNLSLLDIKGELLAVPQFTLAADTKKGTRAGFSTAASPEEGCRLFDRFVFLSNHKQINIKTGRFGADMKVSLVNDGPVTFWLQSSPSVKQRDPSGRSES
jgi:D-tyrosyl-tRNA(Tyr) deacylase